MHKGRYLKPIKLGLRHAGMAKLADALRLGRSSRKAIQVQILLPAHVWALKLFGKPRVPKRRETSDPRVAQLVEQASYTR